MIEHFSTRQLMSGQKLDYWNQLLDQTYSGLVADSPRSRFDAQMSRWLLGEMTMIWPKSAAVTVARHRGAPRVNDQRLVVHLLHSGECKLRQRRSETVLRKGDMAICASEEFYQIDVDRSHEMLVVEMPRALVADRLPALDDRIGRCISGANASTRLLHNFLLSLWREGAANFDAITGQAYADLLADLLVISLQERSGPAVVARNPLYERMMGVVEARIGDCSLTPSSLASELGVSLRTLQTAAAECGATPVAYITRRRLEMAAHRLATDSRAPITQVAFDSGFADSAYFARRFHDHFGVSPSQYRSQH